MINEIVWIDDGDDLYNEIRFAARCHMVNGGRVDCSDVRINMPDSAIDSRLVSKCKLLTQFYGHYIEVRLTELVIDPDTITGRWIGTFSVEPS